MPDLNEEVQPTKKKRAVILSEITCPHCKEAWFPRTPDPIKCPRCGKSLRKVKRLLNREKPLTNNQADEQDQIEKDETLREVIEED